METIEQLEGLKKDEDDVVTDYAYEQTVRLFTTTLSKLFDFEIPRFNASVNSRGGVDIVWDAYDNNLRRYDKRLWITMPATNTTTMTLYYRDSYCNAFIDDATDDDVWWYLENKINNDG